MKKCFITLLGCLAGMLAYGQIPDGSDAPDFTVTDVMGNTHTLSQYLAQGKTVIMDISATWCSPCWNFHHTGTLEELYNTYGQGGSEEIVVLFIEGDGNTPLECLFGISDENLTWGNWVEHSSFPMIDSEEVAALYGLEYFPTFFRICPDGKVNRIPQPPGGVLDMDMEYFKGIIDSNCTTLEGLQSHAIPKIEDISVCEGSSVTPHVSLTNFGTQAITTATIELRQGATVLGAKEFTGNIAVSGEATVNLDPVEMAPGDDYKAVITSINGAAPLNTTATICNFNAIEAIEGYNNIIVRVHTDLYPGEISWVIKNSAGTVVASAEYQPGTGPQGMGGPDSDTTKVHMITLPGADCYSIEAYDSYGDGWSAGDAQHGIEVESGGEVVFNESVGNFGPELIFPYAFRANGLLGNATHQVKSFAMFPNPASGSITISTQETVDITITDMAGKTVLTARGINNGDSISLEKLQAGIYIARLDSGKMQWNEKIIIK